MIYLPARQTPAKIFARHRPLEHPSPTLLSGVRDAPAARRLRGRPASSAGVDALRFGDRPGQVLVTGATGFIGQRLVDALLADGHAVTLLTRRPKQAARLFDGQVRCVQGLDELPDTAVLDVVVNLAGARILGRRWTAARKAALLASRVGVIEQVVQWIGRARRKPRLLLSASAIGYYGIQRPDDDRPLDEDAPPQPIFMSTLCQQWEAAARRAGDYGVAVACLRFGLVLGLQGALPMMLLPVRLGLGGPLGGGRQLMSWIHIEDLLRGMAHLWRTGTQASGGHGNAWNFTAPEAVRQEDFSRAATRLLKRPCLLRAPAAPLRAVLGEQADLLLEGQRVVPARLLAQGFVFRYPGLRAALASLTDQFSSGGGKR